MSVWDDPQLKQGAGFISFDNPGDEIDGLITLVRTHTFPATKAQPERTVPQLLMTLTKCTADPGMCDGQEYTLTPGTHLRALLSQLRPEAGDRLWAKYLRNEKTGQPSPKKVFDAKVQRGVAPVPASASAPREDEPPF